VRRSALALIGALVALAAGGCQTQPVCIHSLPPETPAADNAAAIERAKLMAAAASQTTTRAVSGEGGTAVPQLTIEDAPSMYTYDPWERYNRVMYRIDARIDEAVLLPAANAYRWLPAPMRAGVHNFFTNLAAPTSVLNYVLQLQFGPALRGAGRFVVNSTVGIAGLLDPASKIPLRSPPTGFSDTLSVWGMHPGPYLVLPVLGPATLRDGLGDAADYAVAYLVNVADTDRGYLGEGLGVISAVDTRASIDFRYYDTASPFEYELVRFLYVRRELIEDTARRLHSPLSPPNPNQPAGR